MKTFSLSKRARLVAIATALALSLTLTFVTAQKDSSNSAQASASDPQDTPSWAGPATIYEVNVRQFSDSHDFKGVTSQLNRLKSLGVGILWLMPIHPIGLPERKGTLGSPYSVADYKAVNPEYGTDADLRELIAGAHERGMHVIMDWVPNHTAWDNPWTAHKDWYLLDGSGNFQPPLGTDWSDVIQLNYDNADMRLAMIDAMKYWVTNFSIDGFRQDAAGMEPVDFWEQAKASLVTTGRPLFWLAENGDRTEFLDTAFSANYNWPGLELLKNVAAKKAGKAEILSQIIDETYTHPDFSFGMNMITNHDENSWGGTVQSFYGSKEKALATLMFTWPGMPLLYNGQETGLDKQLAFFESDPIDWNYRSPLQTFYKKLVSLKKNNPALWAGATGGNFTAVETKSSSMLAFKRAKGKSVVYTVINLGSAKKTVTLKFGSKTQTLYNLSTGKKETIKPTSKVTLSGWTANVYSTAR
jgi:glycosidase